MLSEFLSFSPRLGTIHIPGSNVLDGVKSCSVAENGAWGGKRHDTLVEPEEKVAGGRNPASCCLDVAPEHPLADSDQTVRLYRVLPPSAVILPRVAISGDTPLLLSIPCAALPNGP